jgi:hypothetical protein
MALAALFVIPYVSALLKINADVVYPWLASVMAFALPSYCGVLLGLVISRSDDISRYIREKHHMTNHRQCTEVEKCPEAG